MSLGRLPEIIFALLLMGTLGLLWLGTRMSESQAQSLFWAEVHYGGRERLATQYFGMERQALATTPASSRFIEHRFRRLYPNYRWRLALVRLRLTRLQRMLWNNPAGGLPGSPLGWLVLPGLAEAVRRRAVRQTSLLTFPNELVFHLGFWLTILGALGFTVGYWLSPVAVPSGLFLLLLTAGVSGGLWAVVPNWPGRWRDAD